MQKTTRRRKKDEVKTEPIPSLVEDDDEKLTKQNISKVDNSILVVKQYEK